jgi:hypothetical protein
MLLPPAFSNSTERSSEAELLLRTAAPYAKATAAKSFPCREGREALRLGLRFDSGEADDAVGGVGGGRLLEDEKYGALPSDSSAFSGDIGAVALLRRNIRLIIADYQSC